MNMGERIKQLRKQKGLTQEELGEFIGVKKAAIMKYEKGNVKNIKRDSIEILSKLFNVSPSYLMCLEESNISDKKSSTKYIPLFDNTLHGNDYFSEENHIGNIEVNNSLFDNNKNYFCLKVNDDTMFPVFIKDDIVIIEKQHFFEIGDIVVFIMGKDKILIRKVLKNKKDIIFEPFNKKYEPIIFKHDKTENISIKILGIVKQLTRDF